MRITIEMTDVESGSTTFNRTAVAGSQAGQDAHASNGGVAPEHLLLALGAQAEPGATVPNDHGHATDAGAPASWLVDAMRRGADRMADRGRGAINGG